MTRERWEQILFAHVPDEVVQDMLNEYVLELEARLSEENDDLRKFIGDLWPFALHGMYETCPDRQCCLFVECDADADERCHIEERMTQRAKELGIEVDG